MTVTSSGSRHRTSDAPRTSSLGEELLWSYAFREGPTDRAAAPRSAAYEAALAAALLAGRVVGYSLVIKAAILM